MKLPTILFTSICLLLAGTLTAQRRDTAARLQPNTSAMEETRQISAPHTNGLKYIKTLGGAYLNSGNGTDRLGGNKIGFLESGIVMEVIEDEGSLYKVRLSDNRYAFIPKEYAADTAAADFLPVITSGSISVANAGATDRISIALEQKRCYIIREEVEPEKMIIELYGVQNNSNWITQYLDLESVDRIDIAQVDSDILRLTVYLKNRSCWGYSVKYEGGRLVIDIKHAPELRLKGMVIGVDAGHGGPDNPGARGVGSLVDEKDLNLDMALRLKRILESKGARVVLARDKDTSLTMAERKAIFLENNIDMLISIHCNAGGTASGTSTYYKHIQNRMFAKSLLESILKIKGVKLFGLVGNFNFSLNAPTEYPNALVETLFLSHPQDEARLNDPVFREQIMKQVAKGVKNYLKYCRKQEKR